MLNLGSQLPCLGSQGWSFEVNREYSQTGSLVLDCVLEGNGNKSFTGICVLGCWPSYTSCCLMMQ
jgi:hypothetical protein